VQLMTGHASRIIGESSQILQGGAYPEELFHGRVILYKFQYTGARVVEARKGARPGCDRMAPQCPFSSR
jgi:hypothetical protein